MSKPWSDLYQQIPPDRRTRIEARVGAMNERHVPERFTDKTKEGCDAQKAWLNGYDTAMRSAVVLNVLNAFDDLSAAEVHVFGGFVEYAGRLGKEQTALRNALAELSLIVRKS